MSLRKLNALSLLLSQEVVSVFENGPHGIHSIGRVILKVEIVVTVERVESVSSADGGFMGLKLSVAKFVRLDFLGHLIQSLKIAKLFVSLTVGHLSASFILVVPIDLSLDLVLLLKLLFNLRLRRHLLVFPE